MIPGATSNRFGSTRTNPPPLPSTPPRTTNLQTIIPVVPASPAARTVDPPTGCKWCVRLCCCCCSSSSVWPFLRVLQTSNRTTDVKCLFESREIESYWSRWIVRVLKYWKNRSNFSVKSARKSNRNFIFLIRMFFTDHYRPWMIYPIVVIIEK